MKTKLLFLFLIFTQSLFAQIDCGNNAGFESGTTAGWTFKYGSYGTGTCPPLSDYCGTFDIVLDSIGCLNGRHTIVTGSGYDPNSVAPHLVPVVAPNGGTYSFKIGDGTAGGYGSNCPGPPPNCYARAEAIRFSFNVYPQNAIFTYRYAAFIQDPGHYTEEQPAAEMLIKNSNDSIISNGYRKLIGRAFDSCSSNIECPYQGIAAWKYSDWTNVTTDLTNYIGESISIEFRTHDCFPGLGTCNTYQAGTHSAYLYIDAYCSAFTGTNELTNNDAFKIYPNPTTNHFTISLNKNIKEGEVSVFNVMGEKVYEESLTPGPSPKERGEIQVYLEVPGGIYFVQVRDGERQWPEKIVIE